MKIYMVIARYHEDFEEHGNWNVAAFTSNEAAQEYVAELTNEIISKDRRFFELDSRRFVNRWSELPELTDEEKKELHSMDNWLYRQFFDNGWFEIEECELHE